MDSGEPSPHGYIEAINDSKNRVVQHSAHYLVRQDGSIEQLVKLEETNWGPLVHKEPDCLGYNRCRQREPHEHGFACDKTCNECFGQCHPDCPANSEHMGTHEKD